MYKQTDRQTEGRRARIKMLQDCKIEKFKFGRFWSLFPLSKSFWHSLVLDGRIF
jgi:hypothetical protein